MTRRILLPTVLAAACAGQPASNPGPAPASHAPDRPTVEVRTPQKDALLRVVRLEAQPDRIELAVGDTATFHVAALDAHGRTVSGVPLHISGADNIALLLDEGIVIGLRPGTATLVIQAPAPEGTDVRPVEIQVPVNVHAPADDPTE